MELKDIPVGQWIWYDYECADFGGRFGFIKDIEGNIWYSMDNFLSDYSKDSEMQKRFVNDLIRRACKNQ